MTEQIYSESFYAEMSDGSRASARLVVPIIQALFSPRSVVDVGCGLGAWLAEFRRNGVVDVVGLDGAWVREDQLLIPRELFRSVDLSDSFALDRRFDLALCLEVAEHVAAEHAPALVKRLTSLAPVVVFSAAIPFQNGANHVNEQWPSYWRTLFSECDYSVLDCLRPRLWNDANVEYWYAQNMLVFMSPEAAQMRSNLGGIPAGTQSTMFDLVHPRAFLAAQAHNSYLENRLSAPPLAHSGGRLRTWLKKRFRRSSATV